MLEGLEITIADFGDIELGDRSDAEYYSKESLAIEQELINHDARRLAEYSTVVASAFYPAATELYESGDVPFARCVDCVPFPVVSTLQDGLFERIPRWFLEDSGQIHKVGRGDIILTKVGTPCFASVVHDFDEVALSRTVLGLTNIHGIDPYYLTAFLRCRFGFWQLMRQRELTIQYQLTLERVRDVLVFKPSQELQATIAGVMTAYVTTQQGAASMTVAAEQTLLRALELHDWQPPEPLTYTRPSRDAFAAGRLDAEYFYPAKQAALEKLTALPGRTVEEMFSSVRDLWQPKDAPANQSVRNYDLTDALSPFLGTETEAVYPAAIASTKKRVLPGDIVVSRLRSYLREIAVVLEGDELPMVASTEFIVLRPKAGAMRVEALLVYLRSTLPQLIFKWSQDGSNHPRFDEKELLNLRVPELVIAQQDTLADMLQSTITSRRRAAELLDAAKRAVEIAIEDSEAAALAWLDSVAGTLAESPRSCDPNATQEPRHDHQATATPRPAPEAMARRPSGRGQPARGLSPTTGDVRPEFDGAGAGAGGPGPAAPTADSTRPLDATRELATAAGPLTYTEVSERLAVNIVRCLDAMLDAEPEAIAITPDWLRDIHLRLAGDLFPEWAGRFRTTDVQVGTHFPPPAHAIAVQLRDFCLDLEERLRHLTGAESIAELLAWVDWRFQWIHPFKDFNGRVGRILLVALAYKLGLPPMDPADAGRKEDYFAALRGADAGDPAPLRALWLARLARA